MKAASVILTALTVATLIGCSAQSSVRMVDRTQPAHNNQVCMMSGALPAGMSHSVVGEMQSYKQTYGSVDEVLEEMAEQARRLGANAIVGLNARQHFGFFVWKVVRPIGYGTAIKVAGPIDCASLGGIAR